MFRIVAQPINPRALEGRPGEHRGALVTFLGVVRDRADDGRSVIGLSYEAFEPMVLTEFETIAAEARERFGDVRLSIVHRVGELAIGEIAVAVVAGAPHRAAAFDACRYAVDQLKLRAPIWKKERYADGGADWKANVGNE